jgi:hypothetical protein
MVAVTNHDIPDDPRNDPEHPIPYLNVLDVSAYLKQGGADLSIVIASPLLFDERSQTRLLDKIQGYLSHIHSDDFRRDAGVAPTPENTKICVLLHPDSAQEIRDLLERCRVWVTSHGATLVVEGLPSGQTNGT